jgi:predicted ATP-grasp superfamily ATP-dependent carboligase
VVRGTIIVTDADERSALAVTRSLGRAGWRIVTCAAGRTSLAGRSRHSARSVVVPDALREPEAFAAQVVALATAEGARYLIPISEAALLALLPVRESLPPGAIPWPGAEAVRAVCDKRRVLEAAPAFGIGVPRQAVLDAPTALPNLPELTWPVVAKPARSVNRTGGSSEKFTARHVASLPDLERLIAGYSAAAFPLLLQERVVGPGVGIFLLVWDDVLRASFAHRRLREKPPSGGVSVYRESIAADPALVERSRRLLEHFGWQGVAMVEYKVDQRSGTPMLMEINGRFWGSLQLAVDAGVDFPWLLIECAEGRAPEAPQPYDIGTRLRWWWGDVDQLLQRLRRPPAELGLPEGAPGRLQSVAEFMNLLRVGDRNEVLRLDDPAPFLHESLHWFLHR